MAKICVEMVKSKVVIVLSAQVPHRIEAASGPSGLTVSNVTRSYQIVFSETYSLQYLLLTNLARDSVYQASK